MSSKRLIENVGQNRDRWLEYRQSTIGSSEIPVVAKLNPYKSPLELWAEKTGKVEPFVGNDATWLGQKLEPVIAELFTKRTGKQLIEPDTLYGHSEYPFATATPDRFYLDDGIEAGIVECKNTSQFAAADWSEYSAPDAAVLQVQWQMGVIGWPEHSYIAGLVGGNAKQFYCPEFEYSAAIFGQLIEMAERFMTFVKKDLPPEAGPGDRALINDIIQERKDSEAQLSHDWVATCDQWARIKNTEKGLARELKETKDSRVALENDLMMGMGQNSRASCGQYQMKVTKTERKGHYVEPCEYYQFRMKEIK